MADITGTEGADKLIGTADSDKITALGGDDTILGSVGFDNVDGGSGQDTIDFSNTGTNIDSYSQFLLVDGSQFGKAMGTRIGPFADYFTNLSNVETIIANPTKSGYITNSSSFIGAKNAQKGNVDIDLSVERLTFYATADNSVKSFTVKNFQDISLTSGKNRIKGNDLNNKITVFDGENVAIGSKGNDSYFFSKNGTLDYSDLGTRVTLAIDTPIVFGDIRDIGTVDKNGLGKDRISRVQKIIGTNNQVNTIDGRSAASDYSLNVNLAQNSLTINNSNGTSQQIEVNNFTHAVGTKAADTIVGGNKGGRLTGGGGSDTITGGSGNDVILGASAGSRGVGEVDTLTGGGGKDKFFVGNANGAFYVGNGASDYALITDFNLVEDSISIGSLKDYSVVSSGSNTIDLYAGKDTSTRDLIAKIQLSSPLASTTTATSRGISLASSNTTVDPISSQLNIISVDNSADIIA